MGERKKLSKTALALAGEDAMVVQTMGGRIHVRWDETVRATPHGQLVFFAEFLATAGVFDRWVEGCPLSYSSSNASSKRDVLGTLILNPAVDVPPEPVFSTLARGYVDLGDSPDG